MKEKDYFILILDSNKKTGFIGLVDSLNSLFQLYWKLISSNKLEYFKLYKISEDHLELFFGSIRDHEVYNNNPTTCQFQSIYTKLVI